MNVHHGMNLPTGVQHRKHLKAKFTGGRCTGCGGLIVRGAEIVVDTAFGGGKTTKHDAAVCGA